MNPYIDVQTKPEQPAEFSVHKLSEKNMKLILSGLDKLAMDSNFVNRKEILDLCEGLNTSFEKLVY